MMNAASFLRVCLLITLLSLGAIAQQTNSPTLSLKHEFLTDTSGVDFSAYLKKLEPTIAANWQVGTLPPAIRLETVSVEFSIHPDGKVTDMRVASPSGRIDIDRAAWAAISASKPFSPLPSDFHGKSLGLRLTFQYKPR